MAVGIKAPLAGSRDHQRRFAFAFERKGPNLPGTFRGAPRIEKVFAVVRPTVGRSLLLLRVAEQELFVTAAVRVFAVEVEVTVSSRSVGDPLAIRRPYGRSVGDRSEGEAGANAARQIENPDVVYSAIDLESDPVSLRGDGGKLQSRELVGDGADLFAQAIRPN